MNLTCWVSTHHCAVRIPKTRNIDKLSLWLVKRSCPVRGPCLGSTAFCCEILVQPPESNCICISQGHGMKHQLLPKNLMESASPFLKVDLTTIHSQKHKFTKPSQEPAKWKTARQVATTVEIASSFLGSALFWNWGHQVWRKTGHNSQHDRKSKIQGFKLKCQAPSQQTKKTELDWTSILARLENPSRLFCVCLLKHMTSRNNTRPATFLSQARWHHWWTSRSRLWSDTSLQTRL